MKHKHTNTHIPCLIRLYNNWNEKSDHAVPQQPLISYFLCGFVCLLCLCVCMCEAVSYALYVFNSMHNERPLLRQRRFNNQLFTRLQVLISNNKISWCNWHQHKNTYLLHFSWWWWCINLSIITYNNENFIWWHWCKLEISLYTIIAVSEL